MRSSILRQFNLPPRRPLPPIASEHLVLPAISNLRKNWHHLHDVDRALAVREIVQLGVSRRRLAREMGLSEGLFRHLLKALEAEPSDIQLARQNAISTNELVRRAKPESSTSSRQPSEPVPRRQLINAAQLFRKQLSLGWQPIMPVPLLPVPPRTWRKS
jgi:hypothetical protein